MLAQHQTRLAKNQTTPPPTPQYQEDAFEQLRNLSGRIDVVENQVVQLNGARSGEKDSFGREKQAIEQKFLAYEDALKKLEAQVHALSEELNAMKTASAAAASAPSKPEKGGKDKNDGKSKKSYDEGEALFDQKKYKEAILSYQKYRDANPKGKHYADATYKMGVCFQEVKMTDEAKVFFDEVVNKFSGSPAAKNAAQRAKQLK